MMRRNINMINELRKNCRRSNSVISMGIHVPPSSTFKIIKRLEKEAIKRYVALIDFAKMRFPIKAGFFLATEKKDELKEFLTENPNLNTLLRLSGDYDFYAELIFKDMICYQDFMDKLIEVDIIKNMSAHYIFGKDTQQFSAGRNCRPP